MSDAEALKAAKSAGIVFLLFVFSGFKSCEEIKFATTGKTVEARVNRIEEADNRRNRQVGYNIWYIFYHEGREGEVDGYTRTGMDGFKKYKVGQNITIRYIGNKRFTSRIKGTGSPVWPILFGAMTVLMVVSVIRMGTVDRVPT